MDSSMLVVPRSLGFWTAPLVPIALALTVGMVADRHLVIPFETSLVTAFVCAAAVAVAAFRGDTRIVLVALWLTLIALGAAFHHLHRHYLPADDLSRHAAREPHIARLRGVVHSAPISFPGQIDPLRTQSAKPTVRFAVRVTERQDITDRQWMRCSGLSQVTLQGRFAEIPFTAGDEVELLGRLAHPGEPMNPGEFDYANFLRDQGITTTLTVLETDEAQLVRRGWPTSLWGVLAVVREWGQASLKQNMSAHHDLAAALLLGEGSGLGSAGWDKYQRSGIVHVLAISGQHLIVLAWLFWFSARIAGNRRRSAAPIIALVLITYALLTGGRPPVMRAAWVVAAYCGGVMLRRPVSYANTFALGWIGVLAVNPTDIFNAGCQLSFLASAVLAWGVSRWTDTPPDSLEDLIAQSQSWPVWLGLWLARAAFAAYVVNAMVWLAITPLVAQHYHNVSPIALLLGPPMVVLTSIALVTGFACLLFAAWMPPLAWLFGWLTQIALGMGDWLVDLGLMMPGAYLFVPDIPAWWSWVFYVGLLIGISSYIVGNTTRIAIGVGAAWWVLGVALVFAPHRPGELRCTFVAVGHGLCTVIETPSGRVIVYDAGATAGPDVTRRHIGPFLWSRGIRRIDDVILSHADLDHFNGLPQLAERFAIDRIICTPTFAERDSAGVRKTLAAIEKQHIDMKVVKVGSRWEVDGVAFRVLHPPAIGPAGNENSRSLVLHVTHADWSMLLTGDLEKEGLTQLLSQPPTPVDVMMAPHHGSESSNNPALAKWAKPKLVVSSQTSPKFERASIKTYESHGATYLATWPTGAITVRPTEHDMLVETFRGPPALRLPLHTAKR
ncbi:MAG: DNA internalization-related competence protein ComEC/Rec2 [Gemmataceae bacterium]|nr:DNA internalization-related competence protein ComEC/Rec2 [Gemmataceae bacterium]